MTKTFLTKKFHDKHFLSSPTPWDGWGSSSIVLIHKAGDPGDPVNFRPIALTSCVGKIFHQVLRRWRSYLWDVPRGVLKFAINAGLNTLPSLDNLKRWGKRVSDRCPFCGNTQTLLHILSNCPVALDQGLYDWRHNSVLTNLICLLHYTFFFL